MQPILYFNFVCSFFDEIKFGDKVYFIFKNANKILIFIEDTL
jgi:hypothetical protein